METIRPFSLALLALLTVSFSALADQDVEISDVHNFLSIQPTSQEINSAISALKNSIQKDPHNYANYEMLALIYDYIKQYDKALRALKMATKYFPGDGEGGDILYGNLARGCINLGKFDEAKLAIDRAMAINPGNLANRMHLLSYYIAKNMNSEAAEELKILSDHDKENDYYYSFYVYALSNLHKSGAEIIELFKAGVKANPKNNMSHRALAIALRNHSSNIKKDFPLVIAELNKSLKLNRKYLYTYISFADTYMFMGLKTGKKAYFKKSLGWFKRAYKLEPSNVKLSFAMGNLFLHTGDYDKAIEKFEYARANGDDSQATLDGLIQAYNNKADTCYKEEEDFEEGLQAIDKALQLKPEDGILFTTKAQLLYTMKRYTEAYEYIKKAIAIYPRNAMIIQDFENIKNALDAEKKQ